MRASLLAVVGLFFSLFVSLANAEEGISGQFHLIDHRGQSVETATYQGKIRVVVFGYTHCPDICPTALMSVAEAFASLTPGEAAQVVPLFVTVDPRRDTVAHLSAYVPLFDPGFVGLTGTQEMVDATIKAFKVRVQIHPPEDPNQPDFYPVDHSTSIFIMDRNGGFITKLGYRAGEEAIVTALREALKS